MPVPLAQLPDITELLEYVRKTHARYPWIYPMVCFAAHTGARCWSFSGLG